MNRLVEIPSAIQLTKNILLSFTLIVFSVHAGHAYAWSPGNNWKDSYAVGDQCYCDSSNFDHELDTKTARTPSGVRNVVEICSFLNANLGVGPVEGRIPYNDIQCGNGPANNAADETGCPGRVDQGDTGCDVIGPRWNLERVYGAWPESCSASRRLLQEQWYMISLPCDVEIAGKGSVREVLADDLGAEGIGTVWKIYTLQDDGNYVELDLNSQLQSGAGYWLITSEADRVIEIEGEFPIEVDVPLRADSTDGAWNMIGSPFRFSVAWNEALIVDSENGRVMSLADASSDYEDCESTPILSSCEVVPRAFKWTENGSYETLDLQIGELDMFDAVWVSATKNNLRIRLPIPSNEVNANN